MERDAYRPHPPEFRDDWPLYLKGLHNEFFATSRTAEFHWRHPILQNSTVDMLERGLARKTAAALGLSVFKKFDVIGLTNSHEKLFAFSEKQGMALFMDRGLYTSFLHRSFESPSSFLFWSGEALCFSESGNCLSTVKKSSDGRAHFRKRVISNDADLVDGVAMTENCMILLDSHGIIRVCDNRLPRTPVLWQEARTESFVKLAAADNDHSYATSSKSTIFLHDTRKADLVRTVKSESLVPHTVQFIPASTAVSFVTEDNRLWRTDKGETNIVASKAMRWIDKKTLVYAVADKIGLVAESNSFTFTVPDSAGNLCVERLEMSLSDKTKICGIYDNDIAHVFDIEGHSRIATKSKDKINVFSGHYSIR